MAREFKKFTFKKFIILAFLSLILVITGILTLSPHRNKLTEPKNPKRVPTPTENPVKMLLVSGVIKEIDSKSKIFTLQDTKDIYGKGRIFNVMVDSKTVISDAFFEATSSSSPEVSNLDFADLKVGAFIDVFSDVDLSSIVEFKAVGIQILPEVKIKTRG